MATATRSSGSKQSSTGRSSQSQRSGSRQTRSQATSSRTQSTKQSTEGRSRGQSSQKAQAAQKPQSTSTTAQSRSPSSSRSSGTTVHLPFVTAQFHAPEMPHVPGRQEISSAANSAVEQAGSAVSAVREQMPSRDHAIFYGALGGAAALSVIEWPVALAIGVGTALVSRSKSQSGAR